jgi:hypothetical protein
VNPLLAKYLQEMATGGAEMPPAWQQGASVQPEAPPSSGPDLMAYFKGLHPEMFSQDSIQTAQAEDEQANKNREMARSFARATGYFTRNAPDYAGLGPTDQAQRNLQARQQQAMLSADVGGKVAQFQQTAQQAQEKNDPKSRTSRNAFLAAMLNKDLAPLLAQAFPGGPGSASAADIEAFEARIKSGAGYSDTVAGTGVKVADADEKRAKAGEIVTLLPGKEKEQGAKLNDIRADTALKGKQGQKIDAEIEAAKATTAGANAEKSGKTEQELRKEFQGTPMFTQANEVNTAYRKVLAAPADPKGDIALIYSYVKILDPGSVVREGEIQLSKEGRSYETQVKAWVTKAKTGEGFTPEERAQFRNSARSLYDAQMQSYRAASENYRRLASERGVKPENVVLDMSIGADSGGGAGSADSEAVKWAKAHPDDPRAAEILRVNGVK